MRTLTDGISAIHAATADLEANSAAARELSDPLEQCHAYHDSVLPSMEHLRGCVDAMEKVCGEDYWPVPNVQPDALLGVGGPPRPSLTAPRTPRPGARGRPRDGRVNCWALFAEPVGTRSRTVSKPS